METVRGEEGGGLIVALEAHEPRHFRDVNIQERRPDHLGSIGLVQRARENKKPSKLKNISCSNPRMGVYNRGGKKKT